MAKFPVNKHLVRIANTIDKVVCVEKFHTCASHLRLIGYGHKQASPLVATQIELGTEGVVTRKELRPNDWSDIWPELI